MDNRAVGVYDSGLGGLTALRELERLLPDERIIYLGDSKNVPYGGRSARELQRLSAACFDFFLERGVKLLLTACGTVSSAALPVLAPSYPMALCGVIEPAAREAAALTKTGRIGVLATEATVRSRAFENAIAKTDLGGALRVYSFACPKLAPAIEAGVFMTDCREARDLVGEALEPALRANVDTLILGCTHYPLISGFIAAQLGGGTRLVDSGALAARAAALMLREASLEADGGEGGTELFVTGDTEAFGEKAALFLGRDISLINRAEL